MAVLEPVLFSSQALRGLGLSSSTFQSSQTGCPLGGLARGFSRLASAQQKRQPSGAFHEHWLGIRSRSIVFCLFLIG